jgi:GNAT superfamily N-acetyltransferase
MVKMSFKIREGKKTDMVSVLKLIKELAYFEKEPNAVVVTVEDLERDGFGANPLFKTYVAEINGEIVGMALFYPRYSTWKGSTIHLEDLIVTESKRSINIGSALYKKVIEYGYNKGVKRIEWNVLDWNTPAIDFYKKTGATVLDDWNTVQMQELAIKNYIEKL